MDRRPLKTRDKAWPKTLARFLLKCRLTPNLVSCISVLMAGMAAWALAYYSWCWLALIVAIAGIQLRLLCNLLDGMMAVEGGAKTKTGELFNEIPDRIADGLILTAAGYSCGIPWLGWLATALALMTAYIRALGGSLGQGQDFCGPGAKPHRMFMMSLGCLVQIGALLIHSGNPQAVTLASKLGMLTLAVVVLLTAVTAIRRTFRLASKLNSSGASI